ncbi:1-phosphofructokinase [Caldicellulosiruptor owensensis OL]|uniref:Tagatose-6-phosphate kinase n=1 Tax=Caldicellulosiruptor owensensis (strain ATCC 700167 / DSM 13100 / OL) TaxID=632518 RepID=E4Q265_CALOW|nr:1-phosphofructokinase [Caldicellulosiruptor owensensis]ADQ03693.1 1-phosphofructokinase [Caldicellulosiruptor owensensis OL]
MIYTVTLNPAIDMTVYIDTLKKGQVNRSRYCLMDAGGKGINVSKVIKALGGQSIVLGFLGNDNKDWFLKYLKEMQLDFDFIFVDGLTRTNIKIVETSQKIYTDLNQNGFEVKKKDINHLFEKIDKIAKADDIFVVSGSLPPGADEEVYAELIRILKQKGAKVIFDADGKALKSGVLEKPDVMKPNIHEFKCLFDVDENDLNSIVNSAKKLIESGIKKVLISMGAKGAVFVTENMELFAKAAEAKIKSTTGAGDSMVAAISYGLSQNMDDVSIFKLALACAAAKVSKEGVKPPEKKEIKKFLEKISLEKLGEVKWI